MINHTLIYLTPNNTNTMAVYYNEFKPEAAHMLRQLIKDGLIAAGDVDERPIQEVKADDIKRYTQCHFFAGIGGWSVALRLAGWPDDRPVWTGSCPCQPFSCAGGGKAQSDERHLWPHWRRLITESKPTIIFGEQVDDAIAKGWLDDVFFDLEAAAYACAAAVLPAYAVEAAHEKLRIFFIASANSERLQRSEQRMQEAKEQRNIDAKVFPTLSFLKENGHDNLPTPIICRPNDGIFGRAHIIHAFGNAIVPQVAAEFIKATL